MSYEDRWLTLSQVQRLLGVDGLRALNVPGRSYRIVNGSERAVLLSSLVSAYRPSGDRLAQWVQRIDADELLASERRSASAGMATFLQRAEVDQLLAREAGTPPRGSRVGLQLPSTLEPRPARWS